MRFYARAFLATLLYMVTPSIREPPSRAVGYLFIVLACCDLLFVAFGAWSTRDLVQRGVHVGGMVASWGPGGSAHPEVEFVLPSGERVLFQVGNFIAYDLGKRAPVVYLPERPASARVDDFDQLWMPHITNGGIAAAVLVCGLWVLLNQRVKDL